MLFGTRPARDGNLQAAPATGVAVLTVDLFDLTRQFGFTLRAKAGQLPFEFGTHRVLRRPDRPSDRRRTL